MGEKIMTLY